MPLSFIVNHPLSVYSEISFDSCSSNKDLSFSNRGSIAESSCLQSISLRFEPQVLHKPLQSGLHRGLMGSSRSIYSLTSPAMSMMPSLGTTSSLSFFDWDENTNNSVKFTSNGCGKVFKQRTHSVRVTALMWKWASNPRFVRSMRTAPLRSCNSRSGGTAM